MKKQQGSTHVVVVIILVVVILGLLGFIFWQNFFNKDTKKAAETTQTASQKDTEADPLVIKELGLTVDQSDAPFNDIDYVMTSINSDDIDKFVAAVYSKKVLDARVAELQKTNSSIDYSNAYFRYSSNNAVYVYWYNPDQEIIDGVGDIINPANKNASSKLYVGFAAPLDPGADNAKLAEWLQGKLLN